MPTCTTSKSSSSMSRTRSSIRLALRAWARSVSSGSRRPSPTRSITRPENACAICRLRWINCNGDLPHQPHDDHECSRAHKPQSKSDSKGRQVSQRKCATASNSKQEKRRLLGDSLGTALAEQVRMPGKCFPHELTCILCAPHKTE